MQLLRILGYFGKFKQSAGERGSRSIARASLVNHSVLNLYYSGMPYLPELISKCDSPAIRFIAASSQVLLLLYGAKMWLITSGSLGSVCLTLVKYEVDNIETE
jgi:hypothetical protein